MSFSTFDNFKFVEGADKTYELTEDLVWEIGKKGSGLYLYLNKGTQFDITVPKGLQWLQSPHDRILLLAALVHDELLERGFDNAFASSEFRRAAIARGKNSVYAWLLFFLTLAWTEVKSISIYKRVGK
jgi:hypothetical protein